MICGNVIFYLEIVEQRLRTNGVTHHDEHASVDYDREGHQRNHYKDVAYYVKVTET